MKILILGAFLICSFNVMAQQNGSLQITPLFSQTDIPKDDIKGFIDPNLDNDILMEMFQMGRVTRADGELNQSFLTGPQIIVDFVNENEVNMELFKEYISTESLSRRQELETQLLDLY